MTRTRLYKTLLISSFLLIGCQPDHQAMKEQLQGYWEIFEVHKDGDLIKSYTYNSNIDYFELITDSTGFRKKVSPTLEGKYIVTDHQSSFTIQTEKNGLIIRYTGGENEYTEELIEVTSDLLRIRNEQGLIYSYRPYEPINLKE